MKSCKTTAGYAALLKLRLVCHFLNEVASTRVFKSVRMRDLARANAFLDLGDSAFSAYTMCLTLDTECECIRKLEDYESRVVGLLDKLKRVETLQCTFASEDTYGICGLTPHIISAIGRLPQLTYLSLLKMQADHLDVGLIAPALTNPKNLERLEFEWHFDGREYVAPALAQARAFIAACSNLKILDIKRECAECTSLLPFSDLPPRCSCGSITIGVHSFCGSVDSAALPASHRIVSLDHEVPL
ncbi:hypothetical protein FA13DRAFT_333405 [Coprinellus micaceus]|uniref:Uncharacterized protein n=1 Tax=Coprinellus micaceus TaxID=71717 RepID=A0A4Y7TC58_COPMI|nr:hypothetical protein FA13DRAFT_333405 [Coprinellus micaceus]